MDPACYHSLYPSTWGQLNSDAILTAVSRGIISEEQVCKWVCNWKGGRGGGGGGGKGGRGGGGAGGRQWESPPLLFFLFVQAGDIVYFMRSGNTHSPSVTRLFWLGDQLVTWDSHDGLGTAIIGMLSSGLSGYSLTHSDIGGYTSIHVSVIKYSAHPPLLFHATKLFLFPHRYLRSKDLFLRWCELAAFTVTFRTHLGSLPSQNWQYNSDNETLAHFFRMTKLFKAWGFYREELMKEASNKGWPVVRHMLLAFPTNSRMYSEDLRYQFMLGSELLVAPVHSKEQHLWQASRVFLPNGTSWVHVWSNTTYTGQFIPTLPT